VEWLTDPNAWIALLTLTVLEIVLGIDNIVFISVLASRLPKEQQERARQVGLGAALFMRIGLLLTISWVIGLTQPLFELFGFDFSGRDVILIGGGVFLLAKATTEIHHSLEGAEQERGANVAVTSFTSVIIQIALLDIVFSLDSVITAIGMVDQLWVMITAVVVSVGIMMFAAEPISAFVHRHPTIKMLALSFLLLIGLSLILEGVGQHIPKGYIYFAMAFSVFVEMINLRLRKKVKPVELRDRYAKDAPDADAS
jgi:predicted tellurium resistance membrane protein TerC